MKHFFGTGWVARLLTASVLPVALAAQAQFSWVTNNGAITITGHTDAASNAVVVVPGAINGLPVTSVGERAFSNHTWLASVILPQGVTNIGASAFYHCSALTNVVFPNSLVSIGDSAFYWCTALRGVTLPDSLLALAHAAFAVSDLRSIALPNSLTNLGDSVLGGCTLLTNITLPNTLLSIPNSAFWGCSSLAGIKIPQTVTNISDLAFESSGLVDVTIPNSVTTLGVGAFEYCDKLVSVTVPGTVAVITNVVFAQCPKLSSVKLGAGVRFIGNSAFRYCTSLWNLTFPSTVTNIQSWAFADCSESMTLYFCGNAPAADSTAFSWSYPIVYYQPGTLGWGGLFAGLRPKLWDPHPQTGSGGPGIRTNRFGFTIASTNVPVVVVEACTNLEAVHWSAVSTNPIVAGSAYFSDPRWTNYPARLYRLRSR